MVGTSDGASVGVLVGGFCVGVSVGAIVGSVDGFTVGPMVELKQVPQESAHEFCIVRESLQ
jgi:hypothetical protein